MTEPRTIKESIYSEENEHHINGISFKLPNIWKPILRENKAKKQPPKLRHHQTESAKVLNRVWFRTSPNSKSTNQERPQNISILCKHIIPDTHSHTLTRWLSDFLVGRVIQVNVNGFLSDQISPAAGVPQSSVLSPLLFLIYVNDLPKPHHGQNSKSQFADDIALWAASRNVYIAAKLLQKDLRKLAKWCAKWRIKLNPEETKVIIFSMSYLAGQAEPTLKLYGERLKIYPQVKFLGITFDSKFTFKKHFEDILGRCNTRYHRIRLLTNKK